MDIKIESLGDLELFSQMNVLRNILSISMRIDLYKKIGREKCTVTALSEAVNCYPDPLKRILDLLVSLGLIIRENEEYSNSDIALKYLTDTHNNRIYGYLDYFLDEDLILNLISKSKFSGLDKNKVAVRIWPIHEYLEIMDINARYVAFWLWRKLKPSGKKRFLDIGCGSAIYSFVMCEHSKSLYADCIDLDEAIPIIREQIKQKGLEERMSARVCDFKSENFTNGNKYDYILMSNILHFLSHDEIDRVLQISYNALEEEGKLIINAVFPYEDDIKTFCHSFAWMQRTKELLITKDDLLKKLSNNSYSKIDTYRLDKTPTTILILQK